MGNLESSVAKDIRRSKIQRAILGTLAMAGLMSVALVAPNTLKLLPYFDKNFRRKSDPKYAVNRSFWKLVDQGFIIVRETPSGKMTEITPKGRGVISVLDNPKASLKKPTRWDRKWRVLVFDIGEKRKLVRDRLRLSLMQIGFVQLQKSVWVYPYDCEDFITLLKADFRIGSDVVYMIVDRIENDRWLREHFSLDR